jgi:serine protease inhibitor
MRTRYVAAPLFLAILMFGVTGCSQDIWDRLFDSNDGVPLAKAGADPALAKEPVDSALAAGGNTFGINMLKLLVAEKPTENVIISPTSITTALGMAYNGARSSNATEMAAMLGISEMSLQRYNEQSKILLSNLVYGDDKVLLEIANSVWARRGVSFEEDFLSHLRHYFGAESRTLDFADPASLGIINGWVEEKTHGKIPTILDTIGPMDIMYLINAVYFNGTWRFQFDPEETTDRTFTLPDGTTASIPTMHRHGEYDPEKRESKYFGVYEGDGLKAASLKYGDDGRFTMILLRPDDGIALADFIAGITPEAWETWMNGFTEREAVVYLPKLELEYKKSLVDPLKALGMTEAFMETADFTGMLKGMDIFISDVLHKTYLRVDEEGTEAAAVTAIIFETTSVPTPPPVIDLNRPFLMAIRDTHTGTILFMGTINDPVIASS